MVQNIVIEFKNEGEALKTYGKLNEAEKKRKQAFEESNRQFKENEKSIKDVNSQVGLLNSLAKDAAKTLGTAFAINQALKLSKAIAQIVVEVDKFNTRLEQLTGLQGKELDNLSAKIRGLAKTYKQDQDDLAQRVNTFAKAFQISQEQAFSLIEKGFLKGADNANQFSDILKEYPVQFKNAGVSAEEFIKIAVQSPKGGVFDDKLFDTVKENFLRLAEQPKAVQDVVNTLGKDFREKLFKGINDGSVSSSAAFVQIVKRAKELGLATKDVQTLVADLGGGALEDLGGVETAIQNLTEAQNINLNSLTEREKKTQKNLELDKQFAEVQGRLASALSGVASEANVLYKQVQILVFEGLVSFIETLKAIPQFVEDNKTAIISFGVALAALTGKMIADKVATKANTIAKKLFAKETRKVAIAMDSLNKAMKANPIGFIVAGVTTAIGLFSLFSKKQDEVAKAGKEASKELQAENVQFNSQIERLKKLNPESDQRAKLIEKINSKYGKYLPNLLSEKSSLQDIEEAQRLANREFEKRIKLISLEAQVKLTSEKLAKAEIESKERIKELNEDIEGTGFNLATVGNVLTNSYTNNAIAFSKATKESKKYKELLVELQTKIDKVNAVQTGVPDAKKQEESKKSVRNTNEELQKSIDLAKAQAKKTQEAINLEKQARQDLQKFYLEQKIQENQFQQEQEESLVLKKQLLKEEQKLRLELLNFEEKQALAEAQTSSQRLLINQQYKQERLDLEREIVVGVEELNNQIVTQEKARTEQFLAIQKEREENLKAKQDFSLNKQEFEELQALQNEYLNAEITFEDYEARKTEISQNYAKQRLENANIYLNNLLLNEKLTVQERKSIEQEILDNQKSLADQELEIHKEKNEKILEAEKEKLEQLKEAGRELLEFGIGQISQRFDHEIQKEDEKIARLEEQKQYELNLAGDNEQKKAFIEEKFAQRKKQLERQKAQAEKEKAKFNIFVEGVRAAVAALPNIPLSIAIAAIAATSYLEVSSKKIPKFKKGSDYVRRLHGEPAGVDTILARINEGEGVVPTSLNQELLKTGVGATHPKLAEYVGLGKKFEKMQYKPFEVQATGKVEQAFRIDYKRFGKEVAKNLPPTVINQITEDGIVKFYQTKHQKTEILNKDTSW